MKNETVIDSDLKDTFERIDKKTKSIEEIQSENLEQKKKNRFAQLRHDCWQFLLAKQEDHATEELVYYIFENHKIYSTRDDVKSEMWVYSDGIYTPNGESLVREIVRDVLERAYTPQRANKVIAKVQADTFINADDLFDAKYLDEVCVENGILNLETRSLSDFTPNKIFFNKLPVVFDPNAKCPNIDKFFGDVLKDSSDKNVLYELFGFCLHKDYFLEKAFMFLGSGRNGKGKTLSLLKNFLGVKNTCSIRLSQMTPQGSSLCELHNRLVNLAGDLDNTTLRETGFFKGLTGRDVVQVQRKYLRDLIFTNYAKMVFACNELPKVYDFSEGFWSRWILLEFPYQFLPQNEIDQKGEKERGICKLQDPSILEKISTPKELSGLLNKSLDGLEKIKKNKQFSYSKGTANVKDSWIRKSDSFTAFCLDFLEEDIDGFVSKKELRQTFNHYCRKHKIKGTSDQNIKAVLENMFGAVESRRTIFNDFDRVWDGIRFKKSATIQGIHRFTESTGKKSLHKGATPLDTLDSLNKKEVLDNNLSNFNKKEVGIDNDLIKTKKLDNDLEEFFGALQILSKENELIDISTIEPLPFCSTKEKIETLKKQGKIQEVKPGLFEVIQ